MWVVVVKAFSRYFPKRSLVRPEVSESEIAFPVEDKQEAITSHLTQQF